MKYSIYVNAEGNYQRSGSDLSYELAHRLAEKRIAEGLSVYVTQHCRDGVERKCCTSAGYPAALVNIL